MLNQVRIFLAIGSKIGKKKLQTYYEVTTYPVDAEQPLFDCKIEEFQSTRIADVIKWVRQRWATEAQMKYLREWAKDGIEGYMDTDGKKL